MRVLRTIVPGGKVEYAQFKIGESFKTATGTWRCTDVGTRTITAIHIAYADGSPVCADPSWFNGPPYAVVEEVFDAYDFGGCYAMDDPEPF